MHEIWSLQWISYLPIIILPLSLSLSLPAVSRPRSVDVHTYFIHAPFYDPRRKKHQLPTAPKICTSCTSNTHGHWTLAVVSPQWRECENCSRHSRLRPPTRPTLPQNYGCKALSDERITFAFQNEWCWCVIRTGFVPPPSSAACRRLVLVSCRPVIIQKLWARWTISHTSALLLAQTPSQTKVLFSKFHTLQNNASSINKDSELLFQSAPLG